MTGWVDPERSAWLGRNWPGRGKPGLVGMTRRFNARFGTRLAPGQMRRANREHRWGRGVAIHLALTRGQRRWLERRISKASRAEVAERFERRFGWRPTRGDLNTLVSRFGWQGAQRRFRYRKGHAPAASRPMFSERWTRSSGRPLLQIKIPERDPYSGRFGRWIRKAVWVWRQHNGEVPPGHCVIQLDGDPGNCDPGNLVCAPYGVRARMNNGGGTAYAGKAANPARVRLAQLQHAIAMAKGAAA